MSTRNPYSQYVENQVKTAAPGKLLLMAYDAAIRFGNSAREKMKERNIPEQSANITKMQNILLELISSLNPKADEKLAANLDALYTYMFDRLTQASIRDELKALEEVLQILTELRAVWAEADQMIILSGEGRQEMAAA